MSLELNFIYDYFKYRKFYSNKKLELKDKKSIESWILQDKHRIEKGLSLAKPKTHFGQDVLIRLDSNLETYKNHFGVNDVYNIGLGAFKAYYIYHESINDLPDFLLELKSVKNIKNIDNDKINSVGVGSFRDLPPVMGFDDFKSFVDGRHSCRYFDLSQEVSDFELKEIMDVAVKAPSVCNRQHWYAHFYSGEFVSKLLKLQNGNRGFTENVGQIAIITSDLKAFYTPHERHQPFTDGGLFAMNLMYAMHAKGVSSCALNWCNLFRQDNKMYNLTGIPKSEAIVMIIAFGYPHVDSNFAKSPRLDALQSYSINK
ncbi:nitroreductase family protein [Vibrio lentus]|uniref:nitroreductase family protein n=1 Tax=Vibrio lentus TaxID=136468 RepID=UPI0012FFD45F|nr:nitroreductase family protein [Vibrio lentus]